MAYAPHEDFRSLYETYTGPDSTGQRLTQHMVRLAEDEPLLVITGADFVIFPGSGQPPIVESFRHSTRGFVELTAVSHLAPCIAWLFRLRSSAMPIGATMQNACSTKPTGTLHQRHELLGKSRRRRGLSRVRIEDCRHGGLYLQCEFAIYARVPRG